MRLTTFTDYGLRVLMYLGVHRGRVATIREIALAHGVSENHLMKVVQDLARRGYVETIRGKGGGLRLARAPETINLADVVRDAEDDDTFVECFDAATSDCRIAPACVLKGALRSALDAFFAALHGYTLADLLAPRTRLARLMPPAIAVPLPAVGKATRRRRAIRS
jgi:Rrf2 family transcriptional regulator, nitric oxide-sensitive transcriptional repressor